MLIKKGEETMQDTMAIKDCLDKLLAQSDTVFIVPHNRPDMDALGSSIGLASICKKNNKKYYIIINDEIKKIESATRGVLKKIKGMYPIITLSEAESLITDNSLMVAVDVNKTYIISFDEYIANGGDGYSMFSKYEEIMSTLKADNEAFMIYVKEKLNGTIPDQYRKTQDKIVI